MNRDKVLRAAVTALTLILAAALIASALSLYFRGLVERRESGDLTRALFSREAVAGQLRLLAPVFALWLAALTAALVLGAGRGAFPRAGRSPEREPDAPRAVPARSRGDFPAAPSRPDRGPLVRVLLFACAAALIVLGALNGGMNDVLTKAINICTECIGLG